MYILTATLIILFSTTISTGQYWVENVITQSLLDKGVEEMGVVKNCIWINSSGFVKYDGFEFSKYSFTKESEGNIEKYRNIELSVESFHMHIENNIMVLYDNYTKRILVVRDEIISNFDYSFVDGLISNISIDSSGVIWFILNHNKSDICEIYRLEDGKLSKYQTFKNKSINIFFVSNGCMYYVESLRENDSISNVLTTIINGRHKQYSLEKYNYNYGFKYKIDGNKTYIMNGKACLYVFDRDSLINEIHLPYGMIYNCYDFMIINDEIYISMYEHLNNLYVFDITNSLNSSIPIGYDFKVYIKNMTVYNDYLIGTLSNCNLGFTGVKILRYK